MEGKRKESDAEEYDISHSQYRCTLGLGDALGAEYTNALTNSSVRELSPSILQFKTKLVVLRSTSEVIMFSARGTSGKYHFILFVFSFTRPSTYTLDQIRGVQVQISIRLGWESSP